MADPVTGTLAGISLVSSLIGGATQAQGAATAAGGAQQQAAGALAMGQAQAQVYNYQAGVAKMNQQISQSNADYALAYGDTQTMLAGLQTKAQIAATRVGFGASGIDVRSGSPEAVQESEINVGNYQEAFIRSNAAREYYGYEIEGYNYGAQSDIDKMAASNAVTAGSISAEAYQTQAQTDMLQGTAALLSSVGTASKTAMGMFSSGVLGGGATGATGPGATGIVGSYIGGPFAGANVTGILPS